MVADVARISAAIRRGLIEAMISDSCFASRSAFPRPFAAASLKPYPNQSKLTLYLSISAAIRRGLIEALLWTDIGCSHMPRFPRPFAAASLKRESRETVGTCVVKISAAIRRGLIEARG